jgi:hypothetical protein
MQLSGLKYDVHPAMLSLVWQLWSVLDTLLYEGMVLAIFQKAKSKLVFLFKSFYN